MKLAIFSTMGLLFALLLSNVAAVPSTQSQSAANVIISGTLLLAYYPIDICSSIHLGSCPVSFALSEHYTQPLLVQVQPASQVLQPQMTGTTQVSVTPGAPNLVLHFNFSLGHHSYNYSVPLPALQAPGVLSENIPLGQIIANLVGLGLPASLFGQLISLNFPVSLVSSVQSDTLASGFNSAQRVLVWNTPSTVSYNTTLTGALDDSYLALSDFRADFSVNARLVLSVPLLPPIQLFSFQKDLLDFGSSASVPIGHWFHVAVSSLYSQVSGSGWYLSGSTASFSVQDQFVTVSGTRYNFVGWAGTGPSSYSGSQTSDALTVTAPIQETAKWQQAPVEQSPFLPTYTPVAVALGTVAAIGLVGAAVFLLKRRQG